MPARFEHFDSIDSVLARLSEDVPDNPFARDRSSHKYEWVRDGKLGRLVPSMASPFWSPFLYRGQTQHHAPCLPAVFRGLPVVDHPQKLSRLDRARLFLARVRLEEFLLALKQHPSYAYSRKIGLALSPIALAQHYEVPTDRVDLSQDPSVAAFFATNARNENGHWFPISSGVGVLYRLDFCLFKKNLRDPSILEWIGRQTLPRPGEQKAWTFQLPLGIDFEAFPVDAFTFDQQESSGQRLSEQFDAGRRLFPSDSMSVVAESIVASESVPIRLVSKVLRLQGCRGDVHRNELVASAGYYADHFKVAVTDRACITFSPEQLLAARRAVDQMKLTFFDDVAVRAVRRINSAERLGVVRGPAGV